MGFCPYCGARIDEKEQFCPFCGYELKESVEKEEKDEKEVTIKELKQRIKHLEKQVSISSNAELVRLRNELYKIKQRPIPQPARIQPTKPAAKRQKKGEECCYCLCCLIFIFVIIIFIIA